MKKTTEPQEIIPEENKLAPITAIEADIVRMKQQYEGLSIAGINDKEGFNKVSTARKEVKKLAVTVDKIRKGLNDDAQAWIRQVNAAGKRITEQLEEIRRPLEVMENEYLLAVEAKKREEEQERQRKVQVRAEKLLALSARFNGTHFTLGEVSISQSAIERISDEDFTSELALMTQESEAILAKEKTEKEAAAAEKLRLQQEAAKLKLEQDQLKKDREELEALRTSLQPVVVVEDIHKPAIEEGSVIISRSPTISTSITPSDTRIPFEFNESSLKPKTSFEEMIANPVGGAKRTVEKTPEVIGEAISEPDWGGPTEDEILEKIKGFGSLANYAVFQDGFKEGVKWGIEWQKKSKVIS